MTWYTIVGIIASILGIIAAAFGLLRWGRKKLRDNAEFKRQVRSQLLPNGGGSAVDKLGRIDDSIATMARRFTDVDAHLSAQDTHLAAIDSRINGVDQRLNNIDGRLNVPVPVGAE